MMRTLRPLRTRLYIALQIRRANVTCVTAGQAVNSAIQREIAKRHSPGKDAGLMLH
jgi:hypothetical protein